MLSVCIMESELGMIKIYVDTEAELWDMDYKMEVAGDSFDETFVLTGNRAYQGCTEASWWEKAKEIIGDLDNDSWSGFIGKSLIYYPEMQRAQRKAIVKAYENCRCTDDLDFMVEILNIIYPEKEFEVSTIRGYSQGEWQDVVCSKEDAKYIDYLEAYYFGKVTEIHFIDEENDDDCWEYVTDSELWQWEREDRVKEELLEHFGYKENEECEVYQSNGYTRVKNWKAI